MSRVDPMDEVVGIRDEVTRRECIQMYAGPQMFAAIEQFEAWWREVGQVSFNGAPACVFALREAAAKARGRV